MRRVARRRNRCRNKAPSRRRAPRPPTRERSRSATNWRDPTACSARPQELTRKFAHQRLRRAICRSFLHPAALAAIRRFGRNKSGVAATPRRGHLVCNLNKEPPSGGFFVWPLYLPFFAFALFSGIPTQVVEPSVSRAAVLHGTAFTVFVEPSRPGTFRPGPVFACGSVAGTYVLPLGAGSLARGVEAAGAGCIVGEGSEIGGGPAMGGGPGICGG
jgi:hypothetical protein